MAGVCRCTSVAAQDEITKNTILRVEGAVDFGAGCRVARFALVVLDREDGDNGDNDDGYGAYGCGGKGGSAKAELRIPSRLDGRR